MFASAMWNTSEWIFFPQHSIPTLHPTIHVFFFLTHYLTLKAFPFCYQETKCGLHTFVVMLYFERVKQVEDTFYFLGIHDAIFYR